MKNMIEELVSVKSNREFNKKLQRLKKATETDAAEKEKLLLEFNESINKRLDKMEGLKTELTVKLQLKEVAEIVSLSYIAKNYFNKTRQWLYQRINNNVVAGKARKFTPKELETLNFALKDISKKIGSLSIGG